MQKLKTLSCGLFLTFIFIVVSVKAQSVRSGLLSNSGSVSTFQLMVYLKSNLNSLNSLNLVTDRSYKLRSSYVTLVSQAYQSQYGILQFLQQRGYQFKSFYINNSILVKNADSKLVALLQRHPSIKKMTYNTAFRMRQLPASREADPSVNGVEKSLFVVKADQAWAKGIAGQGITVAGQDTGVQWDHPALIRQYRGNQGRGIVHDYNWHDSFKKPLDQASQSKCGYDLKAPCDDSGHGTHTIGTMVGTDGRNHIGVAPAAKWMACRNMDNGVGTIASYTECFQFFLAPYPLDGDPMKDGRPEYAPHVINNSWACTKEEGCQGDEFADILQVLKQAGIMVVVSASNSGPGCGTIAAPPAVHSELTFSVGATDNESLIANFSSRGPSLFDKGIGPDIVAPGVKIRSATPGNSFGVMSGTSMAGPHVAGITALFWSAEPAMIGKVAETIQVITKTARPIQTNESCGGVPGTSIPNNTYGFGMIDIIGALQLFRH